MLIEVKAIEVALKQALAIANAPSVFLTVEKDTLRIASSAGGATAEACVPVTESKGHGFAAGIEIGTPMLQAAIKGRNQVNVQRTAEGLRVQAKGYDATLSCSDASNIPETIKVDEGSSAISLNEAAWDWISGFLNNRIAAVSGSEPMLYCTIKDGKGFLACYDHSQIYFSLAKVEGQKDAGFWLPADLASKAFKGMERAKLFTSPAQFVIQTKSFKAALPIIADDQVVSGEDVYSRCVEVPKAKGSTVELPKENVQQFLDNTSAVVAPGSSVLIQADGKKASLSVETQNGKMRASMPATCPKAELAIDARFLTEIVGRTKGEEPVQLTVVEDTYVVVKSKGKTFYVAALSARE